MVAVPLAAGLVVHAAAVDLTAAIAVEDTRADLAADTTAALAPEFLLDVAHREAYAARLQAHAV